MQLGFEIELKGTLYIMRPGSEIINIDGSAELLNEWLINCLELLHMVVNSGIQ